MSDEPLNLIRRPKREETEEADKPEQVYESPIEGPADTESDKQTEFPRKGFDSLSVTTQANLLNRYSAEYQDKELGAIQIDISFGKANAALEDIKRRYDEGEIEM